MAPKDSTKVDGSKVHFFARKKDAAEAAKAIGRRLSDLMPVHTRFSAGWAIADEVGELISLERYQQLFMAKQGDSCEPPNNWKDLTDRLRALLESSRCTNLLPDYGWLDGGCLILADALVAYSGGQLRPGGALRTRHGRDFLDHAFAWAVDGEGRKVLIDGDGVQTEGTLKAKLRVLTKEEPKISFDDCSSFAIGIAGDNAVKRKLTALLNEQFGPFETSPFARLAAMGGADEAPAP